MGTWNLCTEQRPRASSQTTRASEQRPPGPQRSWGWAWAEASQRLGMCQHCHPENSGRGMRAAAGPLQLTSILRQQAAPEGGSGLTELSASGGGLGGTLPPQWRMAPGRGLFDAEQALPSALMQGLGEPPGQARQKPLAPSAHPPSLVLCLKCSPASCWPGCGLHSRAGSGQ